MVSPDYFLFPQECHPHFQQHLSSLEKKGWKGLSADEVTLKEAKETSSITVGLVAIYSIDDNVFSGIENLIGHCKDIEWVGWQLSPSSREEEDETLDNFITRNIYCFHGCDASVDEIVESLVRCRNISEIRKRQRKRNDQKISKLGTSVKMLGNTPSMKTLFCTIQKVAAVDAPVFIRGESGTGKELTARSIHDLSVRCDGPFTAVNCGALPTHLIQSELFGHEKGAFTGAVQRKIGRIEATEGGTLFLDEIGDLPLEMQVNLLRFLEDHKVQRIGGVGDIPVDVRVLAATHVDLEKAVQEGSFREDLYHRLNVLQVSVPSLRERSQDIEAIAEHFLEKFSHESSSRVRGFDQDSREMMKRYEWPGNVRELINRVRRATVMCENRLISPEDMGLERRSNDFRQPITLEKARDIADYDAINAALVRNKFKVQRAAKELGISRVTLYRMMEKHRLHRHPGEDVDGKGKGLAPTPLNIANLSPG
ncbi:sigma-54 dependent transcriptional regulator [Halomonas sp. YLGW01]|uniref:sigma-54 interaction domain-containing protein n=1 Tax=Halomonas sp. YLGW01 TaxID=2773308 RepID=UPI00177D3EB7|nr:sigma-54 dependent transcriptional regulator [Halomonas sp. YLGW01]